MTRPARISLLFILFENSVTRVIGDRHDENGTARAVAPFIVQDRI
jgi:hypothetical protein